MNTQEKIICFICLLFGLCFFYNYTSAQISYGGEPYFITHTNQSSIKRDKSVNNIEIKSFKIEDLNMDKINEELNSLNNNCKECTSGFYYGKEVDVKIDFLKMAQNIGVVDSDSIWLLKIESDSAKGYQLIFSKFQLPKGGKMFIYNEDHTMILGSFTSENNRVDSTFITQNINGKSIYIEYTSPSNEVKNDFFIDKVVYIFNDNFTGYKGPFSSDGSASCQINTTCPEAAGFDVEIKSTALILEKPFGSQSYWGVCSGALINDGTNYIADNYVLFLTSNHCYEYIENNESTYSNTNNWLFLFRHEASSCQSNGSDISNNTTKSVLGATVRFRDEHSKGADYLLLELKCRASQISKYDIAFAGYDYNSSFIIPGSLGFPAVNIHHPKGDVKKITKYEKTATTVRWNDNANDDDHWKMEATTGYKTEPGSSGSPLFNNHHQIIGICHGGSDKTDTNPQELITCSSEKKWWNTYFGKLSDASIRNNIQNYLFGSTADPYIPIVQNNQSLTVTHYQGTGVVGQNLNVTCNLVCDYISGGESVVIRFYINKKPYDYTSYLYTPDYNNTNYYFYSASNVIINKPYSTSQLQRDYIFQLPAFSEIGKYKARFVVTRNSENHANVYTKDFEINVISDATCDCGVFSFDMSNSFEKCAPGSKISFSESVQLPNTPVKRTDNTITEKECYKLHNWSGCDNPDWMPSYVGVAKRTWTLNNEIISVDNFNTAKEYLSTNPGVYYTPSTKNIEFTNPGIYICKVLLNLSFRYETASVGHLDCYAPRPNTHFNDLINTHPSHALGGSKKIIVADCDGHKVIDNANDPLLLLKPSNEKEIGIGTIEIQNVELKNNIYSVEAYKSIVLKPGTIIRGVGSVFNAKITPCPSVLSISEIQHVSPLRNGIDEENNTSSDFKNSQYNSSAINIYPNPTNRFINVILPKDEKIYNIKLYDINGRLLKMELFNTNQIVLNISDLNLYNGFYVLRIFSSNGESNHKILFKNANI